MGLIDGMPEGWAKGALGEVCREITDGTHKTPRYCEAGVPFISTTNIMPFTNGFDFSGYRRHISTEEHTELTKRCKPERGDVLLSKCGTIGRAKEVDVDYPFSIFVGLALLKPRHGVFVPRFLECLLNTQELTDEFIANSPGSTRQTLALKGIRPVEILIPPLAEQKRIVAKVEELLARVNAGRERLDRVLKITKRFRQAVLAAACFGKLTEDWRELKKSPEWDQPLLGEVIQSIEAGMNIRCEERPPRGNEFGIVKISSVSWGQFDEDESKTLSDASAFLEDRRIDAGDFLISRANTIELVGACTIVRAIQRNLMLSDKVLRLVMPVELRRWILYVLTSSYGRNEIETRATGNQESMRNISQRSLREIPIPMPDKDERQEIVHRVEALFELANAIEKHVAAAKSRADKLPQSILAKAFRGELVPTEAELARREGRDYEPASVLLERIRAEREKPQPMRGKKRQSRVSQ